MCSVWRARGHFLLGFLHRAIALFLESVDVIEIRTFVSDVPRVNQKNPGNIFANIIKGEIGRGDSGHIREVAPLYSTIQLQKHSKIIYQTLFHFFVDRGRSCNPEPKGLIIAYFYVARVSTQLYGWTLRYQ